MANSFNTIPASGASTSAVAAASNLEPLSADRQDSGLQLALAIAQAAEERKGGDITILRVGEVCSLADYFVIITGFSKVQVRAIARVIEETVEEKFQRRPTRIEGQAEGTWILADYADVIVHIMMPQEREFYNLEAFWGHAERVHLGTLHSSPQTLN